jgi:hypothetical protein
VRCVQVDKRTGCIISGGSDVRPIPILFLLISFNRTLGSLLVSKQSMNEMVFVAGHDQVMGPTDICYQFERTCGLCV